MIKPLKEVKRGGGVNPLDNKEKKKHFFRSTYIRMIIEKQELQEVLKFPIEIFWNLEDRNLK